MPYCAYNYYKDVLWGFQLYHINLLTATCTCAVSFNAVALPCMSIFRGNNNSQIRIELLRSATCKPGSQASIEISFKI